MAFLCVVFLTSLLTVPEVPVAHSKRRTIALTEPFQFRGFFLIPCVHVTFQELHSTIRKDRRISVGYLKVDSPAYKCLTWHAVASSSGVGYFGQFCVKGAVPFVILSDPAYKLHMANSQLGDIRDEKAGHKLWKILRKSHCLESMLRIMTLFESISKNYQTSQYASNLN